MDTNLHEDQIYLCLNTREIERNIIYRSSVSSTMEVVQDEVLRYVTNGTVMIAET
jgi:hypothetical protein